MKIDTIKLGDVMDVRHGYAFKSEFFADAGEFVLLSPGNCHESGGLKLKGDKEKYYVGDFPSEFLLNEGDMLVVMTDLINTAPILGGSFVIPESNRFLHNQRLGLVQITDEKRIDKDFLYYLLNTHNYRAQIRGSASGATVRHTSPGRIKGCTVKVPSDVKYQKKVGETLSAYDELIENNQRRMGLLEASAQLLYREWFVRLRFPGYEHKRIIKGVPEEWRKVTAFDAMQVMSGGTPKTTTPEFWDGEIPFYTPKDSTEEFYVLDTEKHLTELGVSNCNSKLYPKDTIFITARGTVGNLNLAQRPMAMNQSCYALAGREEISHKFLFCALREAIQHFKQHAGGAVFDAIVVDTFKLIPFVIPNGLLVTLFEETVEPIFNQIENLLQQNEKLKSARDILLPRLMSGEVAV